jgi:hypothetical protein
MDTNVKPNHEIPKWSETRWSGCWNPDDGVGLYLHMGRFRKELELWWVQKVAYLPDGKLVVERSFGRAPDDAHIRTGTFELAQKENGWTSTFDGGAQLTSIEALAAAPRGDGAPSARVKWELEAEGSAPVWDLYSGGEALDEQAGDSHIQQSFKTSGTLEVDGETYSLDGVGYKDHSSGVRKWDGYEAHNFICVQMPDWTGHLIEMHQGGKKVAIGAFFRDGEEKRLESFEMPIATDAFGGPNSHELTVKPVGEDEIKLDVEIVHQCPITITDDGDNLNGIDWGATSEPIIVLMEGAARFTGPNGEVAYGYHERGVHRDSLERPAGVEAASASAA